MNINDDAGVVMTQYSKIKLTNQIVKLLVLVAVLLYICAIAMFVRENSHFIGDDFDHFDHAVYKTPSEMLLTRIDVHFVPFHKLASYFIFKVSPLNFDLALGLMIAGWLGGIALLYPVLKRLTSQRAALLIFLIVATSPAWLHVVIWWSAAVHRIPYLLLQAAACLGYLHYRESRRGIYFLLCLTMQIIALGFYVKAILFPVLFVAIEMCIGFFSKRFSREGIKLCAGMSVISALYVLWYLVSSPDVQIGYELSVVDILSIAYHYILRLGALVLFLPVDHLWAERMSLVVWGSLACWSIKRSPRSALPIIALLIILFISFALTVAGRGAIAVFPLGNMRYYSDEIFVVGIFVALAVTAHARFSARDFLPGRKSYGSWLVCLVFLCYPVAAYYALRTFDSKEFLHHRTTHDFMVQLKRSLTEAANSSEPPVILKTNFPSYIYGGLGGKKSMADILGATYPKLQWLTGVEHLEYSIYKINDDGRLENAVLPYEPDFKDDSSFIGWSDAETSHRWSDGYQAKILFSLNKNHKYEGELFIRGPVFGVQRVVVRLNGVEVADMRLEAVGDCCSWRVGFPPALLRADRLNIFEFDLPDARSPGSSDQRILAIGIQRIMIR